jgi:translocation and assembly module TamA
VRWNSPVGPVAAALAYGVQSKKVRLHLTVGFTF